MPGNTYYWDSPESDESLTNNYPKTSYVDPWDLENYAYIREHLDSLEMSSETSSFGEAIEASSFYYAPLKNERVLSPDAKNFDSLIESECGTAKYAEIEEIYDEDSRIFNEPIYGVTSLGLNNDEGIYGLKNKRSSSTTAHDHLSQPKISVRRRMSYSFGDHSRASHPQPQSAYHLVDDRQKLKKTSSGFEGRFGLSNYGHLKIDYSFSWDHLNKYISN